MTGTLTAPTPEALVDQLKRTGYLVTRAREVAEGAGLDGWLSHLRGISYDDLVLFNIQLSKMVRVGIPLVTALQTLSQQTANPRLRQAVTEVARSVEAGASFSEAMMRHPGVFSPLFINMVRAGEASGKLDEILRRLADFTKRQAELRQQLATALTYPVLLLVVGIGVMIFLVVGIIPKFMKIFLEANVPLPLPTLMLHGVSQIVRRWWVVCIGLAAASTIGAQRYWRTRRGRRRIDAWLLRLPVVGDLIRKAALSHMARTLATLFSSGVPALESLAIAEETCTNAVIAEVCHAAQANVRQGGTISEPLRSSWAIPPMVVQMVTVGEASGTVDQMLGEIADHYEELVQHGIKRVTALIEPVFLMVIGGMVALIMASILLPLFRMVNVVR